MTSSMSSETVADRWDTIPPIRPFPVSAMRLMKISGDPASDVRELVSVIETDPGFAVKLMQVANSTLYGMSGRIRSVQQAVVVLGYRKLHDITVTLGATDVFSQGNEGQQQREQLWYHSLACAVTAQQLAKRIDLPPDEAFLGGILHDVGKLVMIDLAADEYLAITKDYDQIADYQNLTDVENAAFGRDHQELGMLCADEWGLPYSVAGMIGYHHNPQEAPDDIELSELIRFSNQLVACWNTTGDGNDPVEPAEAGVATDLKISHDVVAVVQSEVEEMYNDLRTVCCLSAS